MENWGILFDSPANSGVYIRGKELKRGDLKMAAIRNGLNFTRIDLKRVTGKEGFLKTLARGLKFPPYFGMNWDALNDCLQDLSWIPARGYIIELANFPVLSAKMANDVSVIRQIMDAAAGYWRGRQVPFFIILSG